LFRSEAILALDYRGGRLATEQSGAEQSEEVLESKTEMYCSKGTPNFNGPQTFNFIAKLNGWGRPPIEA
jgi:hypothetical protein